MSEMNPEVDWFFEKSTPWQAEYRQLRKMALDCGLIEELKWGCPCYTFQRQNVVLIHGFKDYCAYLFHKGALLEDTNKWLVQQTKNVQSARQIRFTNIDDIVKNEAELKAYIFQAIEVERAGLKVKMKETSAYEMPEELEEALNADQEFKAAFEALTPGRQRGYLLHISQAKQSNTRVSRIEKCKPKIFDGKGFNER